MISAAECLGAHHLNGLGEIFTTPEEMSRVVFALVSDNPWHDHLGTLAEHLRATGYYAILTDKEPLLEALARLPEDVLS